MKYLDENFALGIATENNPSLSVYERENFLFKIILLLAKYEGLGRRVFKLILLQKAIDT